MTSNPHLHNPHLDASPFCFETNGTAAVLLLHGLTATPAEVRPLGQALHEAGYTVDAPVLPGHATKPAHLDRFGWPDWAETAQQHYYQLAARYPRVFVAGESTGAVLALWLAIHNHEAAGILAYSPAVRLNLTLQQIILLYLLSPFRYQRPKQGIEKDPHWQGYRVHTARSVVQLLALQNYLLPRLKQIEQPILVIQGKRDLTISPDSGEIIFKRVSSRLKEHHWLFDSAHCVLLDAEFATATRLSLDFMQQVLSG